MWPIAFGTGARRSSVFGADTRRVSAEPGLEQRALRGILGELERPAIRLARLVGSAKRAEQLAARGVKEVVAIELFGEREELDVRLLGTDRVPDRDRAIQPDDRRVGKREQCVVRAEDVGP